VQGGAATANAAAGQGGASNVNINGGSSTGDVWLGQVWRPNAILTPWCPQPIPMEAVAPVPPVMPMDGDYPEVRFWFGGKWYVVE